MKKIIAIITISASVAFLRVQAQEAQQTERTQSEDILSTTQSTAVETKKTIDESALPAGVMNSFKESEYRDMSIVTVYEVKATANGETSYTDMTNEDAEDGALDSAVYQSEGDVDHADREGIAAETQTPEEREETGQVARVNDPFTEDDIERGADGEITADEKALYENNKYDQYTEANSDAYAEIAKEGDNASEAQTRYELQVKSDEQEMTLIYDQQGNLVKANKGAM